MARLCLLLLLFVLGIMPLLAQVETVLPNNTIFCVYFCGTNQWGTLQDAGLPSAWKHPEVQDAKIMLTEIHQAVLSRIQQLPEGKEFFELGIQLSNLFEQEVAFALFPTEKSQLAMALVVKQTQETAKKIGTSAKFQIREQTAGKVKFDIWAFEKTQFVGAPIGNCYVLTIAPPFLQTLTNSKNNLANNPDFVKIRNIAGNIEKQAIYIYFNPQTLLSASKVNPNILPNAETLFNDLSNNTELWGIKNWKGVFFSVEPSNLAKINLVVLNAGKPEGLFSLVDFKGGNPNKLSNLVVAPVQEVSYAYLDLLSLWQKIDKFAESIDAEAWQNNKKQITQFEAELGYKIEEDLLSIFKGEIMTVKFGKELPGVSMTLISLRDAQKFDDLLKYLIGLGKVEQRELIYKNRTIRYLVLPAGNILQTISGEYKPTPASTIQYYLNSNLGFSPCFYIQDDTIIMSNLVQNLKAYLDYQETHTNAIPLPVNINENTPMVSWQDSTASSLYWYNCLLPIFNFAEGPMREFGIPWDNSKLPRTAMMKDLFGTSQTIWTIDDQGFQIRSQLGFQIAGPQMTLSTAGVVAALMLPAMGQVNKKAKRAKCRSNLAQIAVGAKMYENEFGKMPPFKNPDFFTELYNKEILQEPGIFISPLSTSEPGTSEEFKNNSPYITDYRVRTTPLPKDFEYSSTPLAWLKKDIDYEGRTVLFMDGHVEFVSEEEFMMLLNDIGEDE